MDTLAVTPGGVDEEVEAVARRLWEPDGDPDRRGGRAGPPPFGP
jgi:hypothetical protein